jgi:hypothetical protein
MSITVRVLAAACLLLVLVAAHPTAASAQPDTTALQFMGFRAGARLDELSELLQRMNAGPLRCRRSRVDPRVSECRGRVRAPDTGSLEVWVSAIDSTAGVITISGTLDPTQLERWRQGLEGQYGDVAARVQGTQRMLQWVRRGRMLRLTWRLERSGKVASVSLVDGRVLDGWARSPGTTPATGRTAGRTLTSAHEAN